MSKSIDIAPGQQRLFQDRAGRCVLLHKAGIAVSFIMDEDGTARVVERIEGDRFQGNGQPTQTGRLDVHRTGNGICPAAGTGIGWR